MADKLLERLQRCSTRTSWPCRLAQERPPGLASRAFASGSAFGCFRHRLQAAATACSEQLRAVLVHCCPQLACTLSISEDSPACMLIASGSVGERPTPQASRRRQERGARTSPRRASCRRLYDLQVPRVSKRFSFSKPHLFSWSCGYETTSFQVQVSQPPGGCSVGGAAWEAAGAANVTSIPTPSTPA